MARKIALNSRQVLMAIGEYRKRLRSVLQGGEDYALLHADILRFLKIVCITKSEYKDVAVYHQPPEIREIVKHFPDGTCERTATYSEDELVRSRLELGGRLQNLLAELAAEYELRKNLEVTRETSLKNDLQNLKKEVSRLKAKLSRCSNQKTR